VYSLWVVTAAFTLAAGACVSASATPSNTVYTLEDCIRIGLSQSGVARNAERDQEIASARVRQSRGLAFPHLSMSAAYTRLDELQDVDFGGETTTFGVLDNYDITATVEQLLYSGGRVNAALSAAKAAREYADAARTEAESGLVRDIEMRFFGILLAREVVAVQAASVDQLQAYVEQTKQRSESGAASEFDLLTARVRLANEHPKLLAAENQCELAMAAFVSLLNITPGGIFTGRLERAAVDLSYDDMLQLALKNRPALRSSKLLVRLGRESIVDARSAARPDLRARFNYNGANSYQFVSFEEDWQWHWNAGLVLSWNLWDGALTRNAVKQKEAEYEKLKTDDEELLKAVKLEVHQAYLALEHAREAMAASRDNIGLAERALEIARTRHETGMSTYLEFTDANLALSSTRLAWFQALHDHAVAVSAVRYACGMGHQGGLPKEQWSRGALPPEERPGGGPPPALQTTHSVTDERKPESGFEPAPPPPDNPESSTKEEG
jgi:outer membrane protein